MPYKDPAEQKKYTEEHRKEANARARKWREENPERAKKVQREYQMRVKIDVLSHYGSNGKLQCCWPGCEVTDIDILTLDHVNNDGAEDRKGHGKGGAYFYSRVRKNLYPEGFQTLCANHQLKKEILRRRAEEI
jgi:hypothetical protein